MCNLYSMTASVDAMKQLFGSFAGDRANVQSYAEIYPKQMAPVLRSAGDTLTFDEMEWGFPGPQAAKGRPITNVRNLASPFWRSALNMPERRCLVPVTRFSEWTAEPDPETGRKKKIWFDLADRPLFAFAGIWRPGGETPFMAFLTCAPNDTVGAIHPKAMPVILDEADHETWLRAPVEQAVKLAQPYPDTNMRIID